MKKNEVVCPLQTLVGTIPFYRVYPPHGNFGHKVFRCAHTKSFVFTSYSSTELKKNVSLKLTSLLIP